MPNCIADSYSVVGIPKLQHQLPLHTTNRKQLDTTLARRSEHTCKHGFEVMGEQYCWCNLWRTKTATVMAPLDIKMNQRLTKLWSAAQVKPNKIPLINTNQVASCLGQTCIE